jgi:hypothetical protein
MNVIHYFCILIILRELSVFYILYELYVPPCYASFKGDAARFYNIFSLYFIYCVA